MIIWITIPFKSRLTDDYRRRGNFFLIHSSANYKAYAAYPAALFHLIFDRSGAEIALSFHSLPLPSFKLHYSYLPQENPRIRL